MRNNTCPFVNPLKITCGKQLGQTSEEGAASAPAPRKEELLSKNENPDILINKCVEKDTPMKMLIFFQTLA